MHEPTKKSSFKELTLLRKTITRIETLLRTAHEHERTAKEWLDRAVHAAKAEPSHERVQRILTRKQQEHASLTRQIAGFQEQLEKARTALREQAAYVSQSEFLDFLQSTRYAPSPINFAKALAGLPYITWRQSAVRCLKLPIQHPFEAEFQKFCVVAKAVRNARGGASGAVESLRGALGKKAGGYVIRTLRSDWYYLRAAVESAYTECNARSAIPYRVFSRYRKLIHAPSPLDLILSEEERL